MAPTGHMLEKPTFCQCCGRAIIREGVFVRGSCLVCCVAQASFEILLVQSVHSVWHGSVQIWLESRLKPSHYVVLSTFEEITLLRFLAVQTVKKEIFRYNLYMQKIRLGLATWRWNENLIQVFVSMKTQHNLTGFGHWNLLIRDG